MTPSGAGRGRAAEWLGGDCASGHTDSLLARHGLTLLRFARAAPDAAVAVKVHIETTLNKVGRVHTVGGALTHEAAHKAHAAAVCAAHAAAARLNAQPACATVDDWRAEL